MRVHLLREVFRLVALDSPRAKDELASSHTSLQINNTMTFDVKLLGSKILLKLFTVPLCKLTT
jgi:hypothetical protein